MILSKWEHCFPRPVIFKFLPKKPHLLRLLLRCSSSWEILRRTCHTWPALRLAWMMLTYRIKMQRRLASFSDSAVHPQHKKNSWTESCISEGEDRNTFLEGWAAELALRPWPTEQRTVEKVAAEKTHESSSTSQHTITLDVWLSRQMYILFTSLDYSDI